MAKATQSKPAQGAVSKAVQAQVFNQLVTQAANPAAPAAPVAATSTVNVLAQAATSTATAPQPVKKPAVAYTNGLAPNAPANAPVVQIAGAAFTGALPATNPANRGIVGNVKNPTAVVVAGNGKQPKSAHGQLAWQAVTAALATGKPQTAATLAAAAGSGGAAFVAYCLKHGWLATK